MTSPTSKQVEPPERIWVEIYREGYPEPTEFYANPIPHGIEYTRVIRKYFCSCGAACTAEEYITHYFEKGHDRRLEVRK